MYRYLIYAKIAFGVGFSVARELILFPFNRESLDSIHDVFDDEEDD
jgi:hypothetical protein